MSPPPADSLPSRVPVGRITSAHGIRGEVRVRILGDGPDHLLALDRVWLSARAEDPEGDPASRCVGVDAARAGRPGEVRAKLAGVDDRDAAAALRGTWVLAAADDLPELGDDEHYWFELVGYAVEDEEGRRVGTVKELVETPAHDVLVVGDAAGAEHLVPVVDAFVKEICRETRTIRIQPIPGLLGEPSA